MWILGVWQRFSRNLLQLQSINRMESPWTSSSRKQSGFLQPSDDVTSVRLIRFPRCISRSTIMSHELIKWSMRMSRSNSYWSTCTSFCSRSFFLSFCWSILLPRCGSLHLRKRTPFVCGLLSDLYECCKIQMSGGLQLFISFEFKSSFKHVGKATKIWIVSWRW